MTGNERRWIGWQAQVKAILERDLRDYEVNSGHRAFLAGATPAEYAAEILGR